MYGNFKGPKGSAAGWPLVSLTRFKKKRSGYNTSAASKHGDCRQQQSTALANQGRREPVGGGGGGRGASACHPKKCVPLVKVFSRPFLEETCTEDMRSLLAVLRFFPEQMACFLRFSSGPLRCAQQGNVCAWRLGTYTRG